MQERTSFDWFFSPTKIEQGHLNIRSHEKCKNQCKKTEAKNHSNLPWNTLKSRRHLQEPSLTMFKQVKLANRKPETKEEKN
jgi:hypothetical protein